MENESQALRAPGTQSSTTRSQQQNQQWVANAQEFVFTKKQSSNGGAGGAQTLKQRKKQNLLTLIQSLNGIFCNSMVVRKIIIYLNISNVIPLKQQSKIFDSDKTYHIDQSLHAQTGPQLVAKKEKAPRKWKQKEIQQSISDQPERYQISPKLFNSLIYFVPLVIQRQSLKQIATIQGGAGILQATKSAPEYQQKKPKRGAKGQQQDGDQQQFEDVDEMQLMKSMQKQISIGASQSASDANFLLGFNYRDDDEYQYGGGGNYANTYGAKRKRRGGRQQYRPTKEYSVQSAFKFILRDGNDYMLQLHDPNENVDWGHLVQVIFNMTNASDVQFNKQSHRDREFRTQALRSRVPHNVFQINFTPDKQKVFKFCKCYISQVHRLRSNPDLKQMAQTLILSVPRVSLAQLNNLLINQILLTYI